MSSELYEVLSLAARYLFVLLGILIVLRAFLWLLSDRAETRSERRRLRDSGYIGEMVVISGGSGLREETVIPVPWEGSLGSVRSCDVVIPCQGVRRHHLWFSWESGKGLHIQPFSGCEALVNQMPVNCRSWRESSPMVHGSFLQIGSAILRLRVFAGLDSTAGFPEDAVSGNPASHVSFPGESPYPNPGMLCPSFREQTQDSRHAPGLSPSGMISPPPSFSPAGTFHDDSAFPLPGDSDEDHSFSGPSFPPLAPALNPREEKTTPIPGASRHESEEPSPPRPARRRRGQHQNDRWEEDWSE